MLGRYTTGPISALIQYEQAGESLPYGIMSVNMPSLYIVPDRLVLSQMDHVRKQNHLHAPS